MPASGQPASAFLRAERHTGSNFFEEVLRLNFRRRVALDWQALGHQRFANCSTYRLSISAMCYVPSLLFSGCDTRTATAQACLASASALPCRCRPQRIAPALGSWTAVATDSAVGSTATRAIPVPTRHRQPC